MHCFMYPTGYVSQDLLAKIITAMEKYAQNGPEPRNQTYDQ